MKKRTRSLLEEINSLAPRKDKTAILESRGSNAISSIINVMEMIDLQFDEDTAADLQKRIMLSIKNRDPERFNRGVKKIRGPK
jgi:predicted secreted Zn-dependent protease|tara:strand:- start:3812 stop:4060 length:249 start_codon:yes stop_codon:yes gene_type:complete